jgi:hypothetical protein
MTSTGHSEGRSWQYIHWQWVRPGTLTKDFSYVWLTVNPNKMIVFSYYQSDALLYMFLTLLCSFSRGQILLVQHLVPSPSLDDRSVHRIREDSSPVVGDRSVHRLRGGLSPLVSCVLNGHLKRVTIPDAALIQLVLLKMSIRVFETCRGI